MTCTLRNLALILFYELHLGLLLDQVIGSGFSSGMPLKIKQNCGDGRRRIMVVMLCLETVVVENVSCFLTQ